MGWVIDLCGMIELLLWLYCDYFGVELMVIENGVVFFDYVLDDGVVYDLVCIDYFD